MIPCLVCAQPVPEGARFCPSCGQAQAVASADERRVVTVLFGDLVGFTTLAEQRDPEQVKRLVDACFERLVADIVAFGGRIDKLLGDGLVALFGAPVAHEDDAERAVRAALRMQQTLDDFVGELGEESVAVQMRIGINTGEVLMGHVAGTDYTAMGDVVNAASRLQASAPPGGVLVGDVTYARTTDAVRYEPAGEMLLKGRERPISTWLAVETLAPPGGRKRRRVLPLVGRSHEMALARAALDVALRGGRAVVVAVEGEGGVGKSRLVDELLAGVRLPVKVLQGSCVPYGESNVWWPIASALVEHLGLDDAVTEDEARAMAGHRVRGLFGGGDGADTKEVVEAFLHLLGHDSEVDQLDPAGTRDTLLSSVVAVISRLAVESPVLLAITDLHWADPRVLELLSRSLGRLAGFPFAVVTTSRPDADLHWPPVSSRYTVVGLPLEPLGREAAAQLAAAVVGDVVPPEVAADLYDRSGGNPLFLEELAALVADGGEVGELPDTLRGLIAARLDRLPAAQRAVIENAAVLGTTGWLQSLEKFAVQLGQPFDDEIMGGLVDAGMLDVEGRRWRFRSDSVRDVAYHTLTKAARAARHAGVARSMMQSADKAPLDDLAHHAATAAELVAELGPVPGVPASIRDDALRLLVASAERAMVQGSLHTVVRQATRALDLQGDPSSAASRPALLLRAEGRLEQRDHQGARADADRLLASSIADGDRSYEAEARRVLGSLDQSSGRLDLARAELGVAVDILREVGDEARLARALRTRGFLELFGGSLRDAEWFFGEAEALFGELGDRRGLAWIDQHRAWSSFLAGDVVEAEQRLQHAAKTLTEVGDRSGVGWALGMLAFVSFYNQRFDEAEELAAVVIDEATERGDEWAVGMMQVLQADLLLWQGQPEEALVLADHARTRFRRLDDRFGQVQALAPIARALVATGRQAATARVIEELLVLGEAYGNQGYPMMAAAGAAMHAGDAQRALGLTELALGPGDEPELGAHEPLVIRAVALAMLDRIDEAEEALARISGPSAGDHPFTRSAQALVEVLAGHPEAALEAAAMVCGRSSASYLDRVLARVASGSAHAALGHAPEATRDLVEAVEIAVAAGDVVACAFAGSAHHRVLGTAHPHGDGDASVLGTGWASLLTRLPTLTQVAG